MTKIEQSQEAVEAAAKAIVSDILADMTDRRGLRQEWEGIDDDIQAEIKGVWEGIASKHLSALPSPDTALMDEVEKKVCDEVIKIMDTYDEQEAKGYVYSPGGLEHMGDVWRLLDKWRKALNSSRNATGRG